MDFRSRDYEAEEIACILPRERTDDHPLSLRSSSSTQVAPDFEVCFDDPLRESTRDGVCSNVNRQDNTSGSKSKISSEADSLSKEWNFLKVSLTQKFSCSNKIAISPISDIIVRNNGGPRGNKSLAGVHMEDLDDLDTTMKGEKKDITSQEYSSRLQELKGEINLAWRTEDRIRALKLSIKVARLLTDTSVLQFYPTLFVLVVEVLDMLGNLVWERIKKRAEYSDHGAPIYSLSENFISDDICREAKETCYNWFCKIGSIHELVPRIYLELAILRCWRFLEDGFTSILERLVMMMRGLADPLSSAYCHLYLAHTARSLCSGNDVGYLVMSLGDLSILLRRIILDKEAIGHYICKNNKVLLSLMEPAIDWIMKCIFINGYQNDWNMLVDFGVGMNESVTARKFPCVSIVFHCLLKHLPADVINKNAVEIIDFMEQNKDTSVESHLSYALLGHKLCESQHALNLISAVLHRIMQVLAQYNNLNAYLLVADAYLEIILLHSTNYLSIILDGILKISQAHEINEDEMDTLKSVLVKIINHFNRLEDILALEHFVAILDLLHGSSRNTVYMNILHKGTRPAHICDPTRAQFLFEVSQVLHESIDILNMNDEEKHKAALISRFVSMVNFGAEWEQHLAFLSQSRAAFGSIDEVKNALIHSSNNIAMKAIREKAKFLNLLKSCVAFNEVTIPSISDCMGRMLLYLETAEIALFGGLIAHIEGLVASAISCLQCIDAEGPQKSIIDDQISSLTCKACSLLLLMPGNHEDQPMYLVQDIISTLRCQSLLSSITKVKVFCAIITLSASLSQEKHLYHAKNLEIMGNSQLFFGYQSYYEELSSVASFALQNLDDVIKQESHLITRGRLALDACNCLLMSFKRSSQLSLKCSSLIDIAESCLHTKDKYLQSTVTFIDRLSSILED